MHLKHLPLIMTIGPLPNPAGRHAGIAPGRHGSGISRRQNALDSGFHDVPTGSAHRIVMLAVPL